MSISQCPVTPLLRCDPRMGATTVSSMGCHIWRRARNIPPGSNPSSNRGWPIIRNVTHIHGSCSALQNTYISCLGHDDASSVSFPTRRLTQFVGCNNFEFRNNLSGVTDPRVSVSIVRCVLTPLAPCAPPRNRSIRQLRLHPRGFLHVVAR